MKAIRRSIKGEKDTKPLHNSIPIKSAVAIQPPKKVIRAKFDYTPHPEHPQELAFGKGDFFHVISRENDEDWYEACNPLIPTARGLVPVSYFDVVGKTDRQSADSVQSASQFPFSGSTSHHDSSGHNHIISSPTSPTPASASSIHRLSASRTAALSQSRHSNGTSGLPMVKNTGSGAMVYGVVMYDFKAERPDELEAEAGESIIIIAQSNPEWFVAKPIKRLGGPGLIPVSFIEIRDMNTGQAVADIHAAVQRAGVPKVEEWKRLAASYKNSSIPLGKFSDPGTLTSGMDRMSMNNGGSTNGRTSMNAAGGASRNGSYAIDANNHSQAPLHHRPLLAPISASIPRYIFENDKYWYIIECQMEDGRWWELSRIYQKFYDFQIALLQQFPKEAQQPVKGKRVLPFMPGPVTYVTDAISNGRRESLNTYVHELLALPPYISKCDLVRELFAPQEGDYELDPDRVAENFDPPSNSQAPLMDNHQNSGIVANSGLFPPPTNQLRRTPSPHPGEQVDFAAPSAGPGSTANSYDRAYVDNTSSSNRPPSQHHQYPHSQVPLSSSSNPHHHNLNSSMAPHSQHHQPQHLKHPHQNQYQHGAGMNAGSGPSMQTTSFSSMHDYGSNPETHPINSAVGNQTNNSAAGSSFSGPSGYNPSAMASNHNNDNNNNSTGAMKVKVHYQDETIIIRVPNEITFFQLRDKCKERFRIGSHSGPDGDFDDSSNATGAGHPSISHDRDKDEAGKKSADIMLSYRDDPTGSIFDLTSDRDLEEAMRRSPRLALFVSVNP